MRITGTNIKMIRGDSESITVTLADTDGNTLDFEEGDTIFFTVKESVHTAKIIFQNIVVEFDNGEAIIEILPEDTNQLRPKEYVYDIQLTRADGSVTTIIKPSKFIIEGDVTYD